MAVLAATAACSPFGGNSEAADLAEPFDPDLDNGLYYEPSDVSIPQDDARVLFNAEEELVSECMDIQGQPYQRREMPPWDYEVTRWLSGKEVDYPADVEDARENGYGLADWTPRTSQWSQPGGPGSDAAWAAYISDDGLSVPHPEASGIEVHVPTEGCVADALRELYGDLETYAQVVTASSYLDTVLSDRVDADPEYVALSADWSGCINSRGEFAAEFFWQWEAVQYAIAASTDPQAPTDYEKKLAVADAECMEDVDYRPRIEEILTRNKQAVLADYDGAILAYTELRLTAVDHAREILRVG